LRIKIGSGLILLNLLVIALVLVVIFSPSSDSYNAFRIILGLPLMFFSPGYALVAVLFPREGGVDVFERLALSFGLSIAIVALTGLILNYTPAGITVESVVYSTTGFTLVVSAGAIWRRRRILHTDRFNIGTFSGLTGWGGGIFGKLLSVLQIIVILGALGMLGYLIAAPGVDEAYTEFYILNLEGEAVDYPQALAVGQPGQAVAVIINHEQTETTYHIDIIVNGVNQNRSQPITLENDGRWEETVTFTPDSVGENQKVEFQLIKNDEPGVYRSTHIWIDVE